MHEDMPSAAGWRLIRSTNATLLVQWLNALSQKPVTSEASQANGEHMMLLPTPTCTSAGGDEAGAANMES